MVFVVAIYQGIHVHPLLLLWDAVTPSDSVAFLPSSSVSYDTAPRREPQLTRET